MVESVFGMVISGLIGQLEVLKRNATEDAFLIIFQNFMKKV